MNEKHHPNGGPAFPMCMPTADGTRVVYGMTLNDYFAAKAMQVLLADKLARQKDIDDEVRPPDPYLADHEEIAELAYFYADAMLRVRE